MKNCFFLFLMAAGFVSAQTFTKEDSLKGSNTRYRNFWDVKRYDLTVEADPKTKKVWGENKISFRFTEDSAEPVFQLDLQQPMNFELVNSTLATCSAERMGDFIFVKVKGNYKKGEEHSFTIKYSGQPLVAQNAPWDGGWVFSEDDLGNPWMSVAQEGTGASVWLPLKDIWSDEPDQGMRMKIITPENLVGVGNGRLIAQTREKGKNTFTWEVKNPINAYSIVPNIGNYVNFKDTYAGEKGVLDLDYWVLEQNLTKAKKQFAQVKPMMQAFEYWFGPYPFYEDSYKLVESPYLGMEHQSSVAYGNHFKNGYLGRDLSGTGVGLKWDFIIIHESGHEWFANNITAKDQADMWIHEGFTSYSETLFTEKYLDKAAAEQYVKGIRKNIQNDRPIIGTYGVRNEGSSDMYYKGANMLHTIRLVINDDEKFRQILRGLNQTFYHQTVTTSQVENYISSAAGFDFSTVFDQYLRTTKIPVLEYKKTGNMLSYRFSNTVKNLRLPLRLKSGQLLNPGADWRIVQLDNGRVPDFDDNYYVIYSEIK